jgi:hypothetical protein
MRLARLLPIVVLLAAAPPATAKVVEETVTSGSVTATLSYDKQGSQYDDFRVRIDRAGQTLVDEAANKGCKEGEPCGYFPGFIGGNEKSISARDLDGDGEPEVHVTLYSGGAHCCTLSTIYGFDPERGDYHRLRHNWLDAGYRLRDLDDDGRVEFDSRDARFAGAFAAYAGSWLPAQVYRWRDGKLVDVTRKFPKLVRRDARRAFRAYRRERDKEEVGVRGVLAGYVADKYNLGQRRAAHRVLRRALRRGDLDRDLPFDSPPFGRKYIKQLKRFLKRNGY